MSNTVPFETINSVLCGGDADEYEDAWMWDPYFHTTVRFNPDGTGRLILSQELSVWIACPLTWHALPGEDLDRYVDLNTPSRSGKSEMATLSLSITLIDARLTEPWDFNKVGAINGDILHESAFETREFRVRLEKGEFYTQFDRQFEAAYLADPGRSRFALRLVFEPSLLPRAHDWNGVRMLGGDYWKWTEFCRKSFRRADQIAEDGQRCVLC